MLTFQELISIPLFSNAVILGGWRGKERSFVNIQENYTNLNESALLILPLDEANIAKLTEYLSNPKTQGLIMYGIQDIHFPASVVDMVNGMQKPVFLVKETNLQTIKKSIADIVQLKSLGHYHYIWEGMTDYWIKLINSRSLEHMFTRLRLFVHDSLILLNSEFSPYFKQENIEDTPIKEIRYHYYRQIKKKEAWSMIHNGEQHYLLFPIRVEERFLGYIVLEEQPGMMLDTCIEIVTHAIPAIVTYLKKEEAVLQTHQLYKENFLYNLLYNNIESEHVLIELGKQWEWDFTRPTQLMVLRLESNEERSIQIDEMNVIMGTVRSTIANQFLKSITYQLQGNIVIIVFDSFERSGKERKEFMLLLAKSIVEAIEQINTKVSCQLGLGRQYPTNMKLFKSFYEAKVALELGKYELHQRTVRHFEDIGIARLLSNIQNDTLHEYYEEILGDLIELDQTKDDFYIETLQHFFQNNGDISKTAEQLYVHPNTLRKRIKKIESVLNCDLNQMEDQLKILVALKIMKMLT